MKKARLFTAALLAGSAMLASSPASAQRIDRIVAFGDSYADDGNLFQLLGINPATTQVYTTGRFSGGTNYIDSLGQILNAPIDNFAIGGANTDNTNVNGVPLGFQTEYGSFLSGGGPAAFPRVSGTFGANDLLAISIGGNDARFYQQTGGTLAGASAAANVSAANATAGLNLLVAAGAQNISFLAGDTGRLPEIAANPTGAQVRSAFSSTFNSAMQQTLSGYAADGVMVHYLDLSLVLDQIAANPQAYGITKGLVCPTFPNSTCVIDSTGYLFYGDALHLTSDGFRVVARYVAAQLEAPLTLQAPSDLGLDTAKQWGRTLTSRMDLGAPRDGGEATGVRLFLVGDGSSRRLGSSMRVDEYRASMWGATVGADFGFGNGSVGIAANYTKPKANFGNDAADVTGRSIQIGGYADYAIGGAFVQGYVGYGWDKHDISRAGVVEGMTATAKGNHYTAGLKGGYLMTVGDVRVGPVVALDYAKAKVDGYTESGDPALTLNVSKIDVSSLRGSAGVEVRGDFETGGLQLRPYASLAAEKDFTGDGRTFLFSQTASPIIVNSWSTDDNSKKIYGRFNAGFNAELTDSIKVQANGSLTTKKRQGNETSAQVGVSIGF